MGDSIKLIKWMSTLVVASFIQQKPVNILGGTFTDLFPLGGLEVITTG